MSNYPAPAKVNLHLAITDVRPDGLHVLDTSFVYVDVGDVLRISLSNKLQVRCSDAALNGEQNLVYQVLKAFADKFEVGLGLDVFIEKKLPSQAGLGGGSSDAATALMVANQLWQLNHSTEMLIDFATPFGADIPCFIYGKASLARGIGEQLSDYPYAIPSEHVVLAWPNIGVSTAAAFKHFDKVYFHGLTKEKNMVNLRARSDGDTFDLGYNDLEESAVALCPPLKDLLSMMQQQSVRAWMSGSGSACVALCHSDKDAKSLVDLIASKGLASWVHCGYFLSAHPLKKNGA